MSRIFEALRQSELEREALRRTDIPPQVTREVELQSEKVGRPVPQASELQPAQPEPEPVVPASPVEAVQETPAAELQPSPEPQPEVVPQEVPPAEPAAPRQVAKKSSPVSWVAVEEPPASPYLEKIETIELHPTAARLVSMLDERGLGAEKFRVLAARLTNLRHNVKLRSVQVTSSVIAEGKSLVSANLAFTLAKRLSSSVLLVEGDLRKPALCSLFGISRRPGIGEWWKQERAPMRNFVVRLGSTSLYLLPAGSVQHPASILQSGRMVEGIKEFCEHFDWIVIDTPPLLPMADSNLWARLADGTLLVVRRGIVSRKALKQALETLDSPKLIGAVLNDATDLDQVSYYGKYYSGKKNVKKDGTAN
jgi:capsular exopolysaccharide synthesis family protein